MKAQALASSPVPVERILREAECRERSGLPQSTRWRLEKLGLFPKRRRLGRGCVGWLETEIAEWLRGLEHVDGSGESASEQPERREA